MSHSVRYQTQNTRVVTLHFNSIAQHAFDIEVLKLHSGGSVAEVFSTNCDSNGSFDVVTTIYPGQWTFKVRYKNIVGDVTNLSPAYVVNLY